MNEGNNHLEITLLEEGQEVVGGADTEVCIIEGRRYLIRGERKQNGEPRRTDISEKVALDRLVSYIGLYYQTRGHGPSFPIKISANFGKESYHLS